MFSRGGEDKVPPMAGRHQREGRSGEEEIGFVSIFFLTKDDGSVLMLYDVTTVRAQCPEEELHFN